ncbi:type 4 pilus major pilin [Paraburkholderia sediminicola]|uniref:type 4 pilus major pilin n=1 Tax=Paraburkholderia sediminicola TaxID=458836 RepID=UPI0038BD1AED
MDEIMGSWFKYLVRLLGVAAVVIILVAIFHKNKSSTEVSNITQLATNIANTYTGQTAFTGLTTAIATKLAPPNMVSGATLLNQWGGAVTVTVDANPSQFDIVENGVPSDGCVDMANKATNYVTMTLNGTTYSQANPLDAGTAVTACNSAATQVITYVYGH